MKLKQLGSNQTELVLNDGTQVLFSYETPVACLKDAVLFRTDKKWSQTTSRHINKWTASKEYLADWIQSTHKPQSFFDALILGADK
jgi:hypothetical protein